MPRIVSSSLRACGADFLDGLAALADQDSFLPFPLDVDRGANSDQSFRFLESFDQHGDRVRDFLARRENRLFANDLGGEETLGLVGELVLREIRRRLGQAREPAVHEIGAAFAGERGDGENLGELECLPVAVDQRKQERLADRDRLY